MRHLLRLGVLLTVVPLSSAQTELHILAASDGAIFDFLFSDVALDGSLLIAGAPLDDDLGDESGSAYLFDVSTGEQLHKLTASDGVEGDLFGTCVAIGGQWMAVGAPEHEVSLARQGTVYVFDVTSGQELFQLTASDAEPSDRFGTSVAIDSGRLVTGATGDGNGSVYVFDLATGQELMKLKAFPGEGGVEFGALLAISGDLVVVGTDGNLGAFLFDLQSGQLVHSFAGSDSHTGDGFGASLDIEGQAVIVGAPSHTGSRGAAYVFDAVTGAELLRLAPFDNESGDRFGASVALDGVHAVVGAEDDDGWTQETGSAYLFDLGTGVPLSKLTASDAGQLDRFGSHVEVEGERVIVASEWVNGTYANTGAAYVFGIADGIGSSYCGPAVPNSSGLSAVILAAGSLVADENNVYLTARHLPAGEFGYFLNGPQQGFTQNPGGSQGNLCLSGQIGRHTADVFLVDATGSASLILDLANLPFGAGHAILAGETWNWSAWFRDQNPGITSNFTDGVSVTFQ